MRSSGLSIIYCLKILIRSAGETLSTVSTYLSPELAGVWPAVVKVDQEYWNFAHHQQPGQAQAHHEKVGGLRLQRGKSGGLNYYYFSRYMTPFPLIPFELIIFPFFLNFLVRKKEKS